MKDTSKRRLWTGRTAIFVAAAIALPLTATVVPVFADDKLVSEADVQTITIGTKKDTPFVKTIRLDGKTIILRTHKEMTDAEVEKPVSDAESSRVQAEADLGQAEADRGEAEAAWGEAEAARAHAIAMVLTMDVASYIPDIDISEITKNCETGQPVTTDVTGFDGKNKSRVRIVMCGKGQAKLAKAQALQGLREARADIENDTDIPGSTRKSILDSMEKQINRMQQQVDD